MAYSLHIASLAFTLDNDDNSDDDGVASSLEEPAFFYFIPRALSSIPLDSQTPPPVALLRTTLLGCSL